MLYPQKIILHAPPLDAPLLGGFMEAFICNNVLLICVVGDDCERIYDTIDELIVGNGSSERGHSILTSRHAQQTLAEVWKFARQLMLDGDKFDEIQEVILNA